MAKLDKQKWTTEEEATESQEWKEYQTRKSKKCSFGTDT